MRLKILTFFLFLLNTFLFATSYSVSKEALGRIDPIVFTFFMMIALVPPALCILALSRQDITREAVKSGFVLGSCLCLGLFMIYISLKYNTATSTAFFPSLNGFLAALMTWLFLRQPITKATWFAGLLSLVGALLIITNSTMGAVRGASIAFIGGLFCTLYVFLADHEQQPNVAQWPLLGVELLTMAGWACLVALLFGDWRAVHPQFPKDIGVILYIGMACTFLPTLITVLVQKYISPITVSFIYILEPILGAIVAFFYLHETLPLAGYAGGALVVLGAFVNTLGSIGSAESPTKQFSLSQEKRSGRKKAVPALTLHRHYLQSERRIQPALLQVLSYPILLLGGGSTLFCTLGGFPPNSWRELYVLGPELPTMMQHGQGPAISLMAAQAACWLLAWGSLTVLGLLTAIHAWRVLRSKFTPQPPHSFIPDSRTLRQLGAATHTSARRREDNPVVQRRRRDRLQRLAVQRLASTELLPDWDTVVEDIVVEDIFQESFVEVGER